MDANPYHHSVRVSILKSSDYSEYHHSDFFTGTNAFTYFVPGGLEPNTEYIVRVRNHTPDTQPYMSVVTVHTDALAHEFVDRAGMEGGVEKVAVNLYPNPAGESFMVELPSAKQAVVELLDSYGMIRRKSTVTQDRTQISVSDLPAALYVVTIRQGNEVISKKLQIIR